jgi:ubiquinol-cytochrome c reductase cytochrome b subunit
MSRKVKSLPNLVRKEALAAVISLGLLCWVAALFDAPMQGPADPSGVASENVKAPWIFVGIQQMLRFLPPLIAGVAAPCAALLLIGSTAYVDPKGRRGRRVVALLFFSLLFMMLLVTVWGYLA